MPPGLRRQSVGRMEDELKQGLAIASTFGRPPDNRLAGHAMACLSSAYVPPEKGLCRTICDADATQSYEFPQGQRLRGRAVALKMCSMSRTGMVLQGQTEPDFCRLFATVL